VRVEVNPTKLASYGLTMANLRSVLSLQNSNLARGQISNGTTSADIVVNGQISHADDYKPLIVGYKNGATVRLSDVADVIDSVANVRAGGYLNGKRAVMLIISRQPGANIIDTNDRIYAQLPSLKASIPQGIDMTVVSDRTVTIKASVSTVERTLIISIALVIIVVFIFLRSPRATLIPAVAVPTSLIGTFAVMYMFGYTLDNLSLMALTVSTGFVVDDAIVVMENITRHIEDGMTPLAAAMRGAKEIGFTVMTISISLISVFIPLLLMGGIVGRLFREFAVTLSAAVVVSMMVSLSTTPMMCAYLLKSTPSHGRMYVASERFFQWILGFYRRTLRWTLGNPGLVLTALLLTIALNVAIAIKIPKGFFPLQDTGQLGGSLRGPEDSSYPAISSALLQAEKTVKADSAVQNVLGFTGGGGATNTGQMFVTLKPLNQRGPNSGAQDIINRLRPKLNRITGASIFMQAGQDLRIGGRNSNAMYQYTIQADNTNDLQTWGPKLLQQMQHLPGFQDVSSDQQNGGLDQYLTFDRVTAARLGQTSSSLDSALYADFGQSQVSLIYTQLNQYYVVLEVAPPYWATPDGLKDVYIHPSPTNATQTGNSALLTMAKVRSSTTPLALNHTGLFPSVTVSFNLAPGMALSDATVEIDQMQEKLGIPPTVRGFFAGTLQAYQQSLSSEPVLVVTALLVVYIVLGILYESLVHPLTIISTLPSASVGAMLALMMFKQDLNVISIIGIVLLIGIVKKNAIMMIDFALQAEREGGMNTRDAIFEACMLRFRPIMMTTMAALFGALPLAFGTGTGSELRRPLGITIVGGLVVSQMLTLYTTPVVYLALDELRLKVMGKKRDTYPGGGAIAVTGD
jgi:multidrug efflux pump